MRRLVLCTLTIATATLACSVSASRPAATLAPTSAATHLSDGDWLTYSDPAGFSIQHPRAWQRFDSEGYPIVFVRAAAPGTNLIEKRMEVDVHPASGECRQSTYAAEAPGESRAFISGVDFVVQAGSGVAAGNIYDWTSYSTATGSTCITIAFVLHSSSSGVYATEPPAFDLAVESAIFDRLISTFRLTR